MCLQYASTSTPSPPPPHMHIWQPHAGTKPSRRAAPTAPLCPPARSDKRNHANGEGNNDGTNDNLAWNCGAEGPTSDGGIMALRYKQMKNFMVALIMSQVGAGAGGMGGERVAGRCVPGRAHHVGDGVA